MTEEHRIDYHAGIAAALKATYDDTIYGSLCLRMRRIPRKPGWAAG